MSLFKIRAQSAATARPGAMEPQATNFIPEADQAVVLPTPELAMHLLRYLVALEDQSGGYGNNLNASQLDPDAVAHAQIWPDHTGDQRGLVVAFTP
jgi:hypothetical protein